MTLIPQQPTVLSSLPGPSWNRLLLEKLPSGERFDLAVRDAKTGFTFFNVQGHQYDYDATGQLLTVTGGKLLLSKEFARALGRTSDADSIVGRISFGAVMQPVEITQLVNGQTKSMVMPPLQCEAGRDAP